MKSHIEHVLSQLNGADHDTTLADWGLVEADLLAIDERFTFMPADSYCPQSDVPEFVHGVGVHYTPDGLSCAIAIDNGLCLAVFLLYSTINQQQIDSRRTAIALGAMQWLTSIAAALPACIAQALAECNQNEPDCSDDAEGEHIASASVHALALAIEQSSCSFTHPGIVALYSDDARSKHVYSIVDAIEGA